MGEDVIGVSLFSGGDDLMSDASSTRSFSYTATAIADRLDIWKAGGTDADERQSDDARKGLGSRLNDMKKREEFLHTMSNFRPKETIF